MPRILAWLPLIFCSVTFALSGCGSSSNCPAVVAGRTAYLGSFSPISAPAGSPATTINVQGSYFECGTEVLWNGKALATDVNSPTSLTATIPASDLTTVGSGTLAVINPGQTYPGGGVDFMVTADK